MSDPLFVGELKNFPPEAQQKIEAAGGLKHFLLESLRFVICDSFIGLTSHAVCFQDTVDDVASVLANFPPHAYSKDESEPKGSSHLNPSAKEFLPQSKNLSLSDSSESYDHASCPILPSPYDFVPQISPDLSYAFGLQDMPGNAKPDEQEAAYHEYFPSVPPNAFNTEALGSDNSSVNFEDACPKSKTIFVQVRHYLALFKCL